MLTDFISGEKFQALCDFEWKPGQELPNTSCMLYACGDDVGPELWGRFLNSKHDFILLTHNSDKNMDQMLADSLPNNIKMWYSQNMNAVGPRVQGIPIGIANSKWPHGNINGINDNPIRHVSAGHGYWCCKIDTNPNVRLDWYNKVMNLQNDCNITIDQWPVPRQRCLDMTRDHLFTFSPPGNGIDCHRHWEIWMSRSLPVIQYSSAMSYFTKLPAIWINNTDDLNMDFIKSSIDSLFAYFSNDPSKYDIGLTTFSYWKNMIMDQRAKL